MVPKTPNASYLAVAGTLPVLLALALHLRELRHITVRKVLGCL
jgi:hypothetical protein